MSGKMTKISAAERGRRRLRAPRGKSVRFAREHRPIPGGRAPLTAQKSGACSQPSPNTGGTAEVHAFVLLRDESFFVFKLPKYPEKSHHHIPYKENQL